MNKKAAGGIAGLSAAGILAITALIKPHEGEVLGTYVDPVGILTSCYGHTGRHVEEGKTYSQEECQAILAEDVQAREALMLKSITVPVNDEIKASLLSFVYNVGIGAFESSTLLKKLNAGDYVGACNELPRWVYANGRKLPGLVTRREEEKALCLEGAYQFECPEVAFRSVPVVAAW